MFFESPRRLRDTLSACVDVLGGARKAAVCRELTKVFEEIRRGDLATLASHYAKVNTVKGEIVFVIEPPHEKVIDIDDADAILRQLLGTLSPAKAATQAARETGLPRKELYNRLLAMKGDGHESGDT